MKLIGPLLQPDMEEKQTSLDRVAPADEFLQGVRSGGRRPVSRGPGAVTVIYPYHRPVRRWPTTNSAGRGRVTQSRSTHFQRGLSSR
jgi:hypothetical protein